MSSIDTCRDCDCWMWFCVRRENVSWNISSSDIKEGWRVCMTTYAWLHADEKEALQTTGYGMFNSFKELMDGIHSSDKDREDFGINFADAQEKMLDIYTELCRQDVYKDDVTRSLECKKELDAGITQLFNAQKDFEYPSTYRILKERAESCRHKLANYAKAWETIRIFEGKNKNTANIKRRAGSHAFNQKKADIGEMLCALDKLGCAC